LISANLLMIVGDSGSGKSSVAGGRSGGTVMRITPEQFLIGGVGLAVALLLVAAVLGWIG
jgi:ABC-type dipeptide/oligopeptide/nickel transport system ATPase component